MAFTPFFQGTEAQKVIDSFLGSGVTASTPMQPMDMNAQGVFRNPYLPEGFYPDDSAIYPDPVYTPPVNDEEDIPNCPPGYVYDEILKQCVFVGDSVEEQTTGGDDNENIDTRTESEKILDDMRRSQDNMFGATKFLDKYEAGVDEFGNPIFEFEDQTFTPTLGGIFDAFTGGNARRRNKFNTAVNTVLAQTSNPNFYGQNFNPLAFGFRNGDIFTMYNPENYLKQVRNVMINDGLNKGTVGDMLGSIGNAKQGVNIVDDLGKQVYSTPTQQVNTGQKGTEPVDVRGSSLVIQSDGGVRRRDDNAYQSAVAKNIARNISNQGQSKFSKTLGGFYGGR